MSSEVANVYAEALLSLAREEDKILAFKNEIKAIMPLFDSEVIAFLATYNIDKSLKKDVMKMAFKDLSVELLHFIYLLIDKNRIRYIKEIFKSYLLMANEALKIKVVEVVSARPLKEADKKRLLEALKMKFKMTIELEEVLDERLISGIRVKMDDQLVDVSMAHKIEDLKKTLKESW